jgi:hypothetical protein
MWNDDWEKSDPLRGKRGWTCSDYVNIGVAMVLLVTAFGLFVEGIAILRETDARAHRINAQRSREFASSLPGFVE